MTMMMVLCYDDKVDDNCENLNTTFLRGYQLWVNLFKFVNLRHVLKHANMKIHAEHHHHLDPANASPSSPSSWSPSPPESSWCPTARQRSDKFISAKEAPKSANYGWSGRPVDSVTKKSVREKDLHNDLLLLSVANTCLLSRSVMQLSQYLNIGRLEALRPSLPVDFSPLQLERREVNLKRGFKTKVKTLVC